MTHIPISVIVGIILIAISVYVAIVAASGPVKKPHTPFQASCVREIPEVFDWSKAAGE